MKSKVKMDINEVAVLITVAGGVGASGLGMAGWFLNNLKKTQEDRDNKQDMSIKELHDKFELVTEKYVTHTELSRIEENIKSTIEACFENQKELQKQSIEILKMSLENKAEDIIQQALKEHEDRYHRG